MLRKFQENYGKGIAAPKKVKKTKKAAPKKPAGRRRGQPVGGRGIDVKAPKPVAAIKPPKPKPGRRRTRVEIEAPETVRFGRKGTKSARPVGKAPVAPKAPVVAKKTVAPKAPKLPTSGGSGGIVASQESRDWTAAIEASDLYPEIQSANQALNKYVKEKHGNSQNSAQSDPAYQKMVKDLFALQDQAAGGGSMPRTGQPGGPQPGTGTVPDDYDYGSGGGSFESAYIDWMESEPKAPPVRRGMSSASKSYKEQKKQYATDLEAWKASKPARATYSAPAPTAPTAPAPTTAPIAPPQPPMPDKFEGRYVPQASILGTPDMSISSNIVGQSYDPSFAESFKQPPQPPGSTFGGYGGQAPMQALNPYAGMAQNNPQPTDFFPTYIPRPAPVYEPLPDQGNTQSDAQPVMDQQSQKPLLSQNPGSSRYGADGIRTYRR